MKATVDLTQDRMFPDEGRRKLPSWMGDDSPMAEANRLFTRIIERMPWDLNTDLRLVSSDEDLCGYKWSPLPIGSAKEYRHSLEIMKADSIEYCDRCGKRIRTPWRWDRTLCDDCSKLLEMEVTAHKIPWEDGPNFWNSITIHNIFDI